ncbi:hypothetical protein ALC57_05595 [Trachymyrmex cornetzi]|uniref:Uncharacterized protein n=1 Tax=Trachymyrmex cornetzi TaxID=471704 RepID=A0A151JAE0_9HYME|nr:hypothetical protein ALC57_05595 [Trachymyrmex cornetzi]
MENHERVERELLEQCGQVATLVECFAWLQRCDERIVRLEELCRVKRPLLTVEDRQSVVARIAQLAGAKTQLERRFVHVGGGYASGEYASGDEQSLVWREIDAAFESRIVTGVVINSNHIEPRRFLEDAGNVVLERCRKTRLKKAVVSVKSKDNACFAWSVVAALYPAKSNVDKKSSYRIESRGSRDDLEYPQHLHDQHIDLPFYPTRDKPPGKREDKLLATLYDKQRYVIHYRKLQQCTRHGLRVTKIHRILQFAQSPWLGDYIELNTQFRTRAKNDFENNLYKLMKNAVFAKTMEIVRNHVDVKLLAKWDGRDGKKDIKKQGSRYRPLGEWGASGLRDSTKSSRALLVLWLSRRFERAKSHEECRVEEEFRESLSREELPRRITEGSGRRE